MKFEKIKTIAVFRALQLGDLLCSVPAFRALRKAFPGAHIALVGLEWEKDFALRFKKYFDEFIFFPGFPGLPEQKFISQKTFSFLAEMQKRKFDLLLQMQGNGNIVNPLVILCGAKQYAGFYSPENFLPDGENFVMYPEEGSEILRHLKLISHLGIPLQGTYLEFPLFEQDYEDFEKLNFPFQRKKYVCLHAGARSESRRWNPENFAKVGDLLIEKGLNVVLTGTLEERLIVNRVEKKMKKKALNLCGKTTLGSIAIIIKNSRLLVSNDTGVSHIAVAFEVPSLIISLSGEKDRWNPLNNILHSAIDGFKKNCLPLVKNRIESKI